MNKNHFIASRHNSTYENYDIFAFSFDDQLNVEYFKYFTSGSWDRREGDNVMIQDIGNNDFLITNVDEEKRLIMIFANKLCEDH